MTRDQEIDLESNIYDICTKVYMRHITPSEAFERIKAERVIPKTKSKDGFRV